MLALGRLRRRQRRAEQSVRRRPDGARAAVDPAAVGDRLPGHAGDADDLRRHRAVSRVLEQSGDPPGGRQRRRQPGRPRRQSDSRPTSPWRSPSRTPAGQSVPVTVTVRPAPLFSGAHGRGQRPPSAAARTSARAQTGTASVTAKGVAGGAARRPADQVRRRLRPVRDPSTNPATPLVQTLTVVTDVNGAAAGRPAGRRQRADAAGAGPRHRRHDRPARSPATSPIVSNTDDGGDPDGRARPRRRSTAATRTSCSHRVPRRLLHLRRQPAVPRVVDVPDRRSAWSTRPCRRSGGFFSAITNGTCVDPLTFTIVDAAGKQTTATLENLPGTEDRPTGAGAPTSSVSARQRRQSRAATTATMFQLRRHRRHAAVQRQLQRAGARMPSIHGRSGRQAGGSRCSSAALPDRPSARRRSSSSIRARRRRRASAIDHLQLTRAVTAPNDDGARGRRRRFRRS